jgi:SagB-type dehydrogenase family enzyme
MSTLIQDEVASALDNGRAEAAAPAPLSPGLLAACEDLDAAEQALVARVVRRARGTPGRRLPVTELGLVHEFLKIDMEHDDFTVFQNITTYKAPPMLKEYPDAETVALPAEPLSLDFSLKEVLAGRASRRDYSGGALSLPELGTLLHSAWGIRSRVMAYNTRDFPTRFAPSTGGLQPVEIYAAVNAVEGLEKGLYHYHPGKNALELLERGNFRRKVVRCCLYLEWLDAASVVLFLTCDMGKVTWKYGRRGYRFAHVDLGIVGENLHLVATALRLRSCMIAGYIDDAVHHLLRIDGREEFIGLLLAVGRKPWESGPDAVRRAGDA